MLTKEDLEDFKQEKLISEWLLSNKGSNSRFTLPYTSRNGKARSQFEFVHRSLDDEIPSSEGRNQKRGEFISDSEGIYSDSRFSDNEYYLAETTAEETTTLALSELGINGDLQKWTIKYLHFETIKELPRWPKSKTGSKFRKQFSNFNT